MNRYISLALIALIAVISWIPLSLVSRMPVDTSLVVPPSALAAPLSQTLNPDPPTEPVKLIFIHHSTGENWLADDDGGLGIALRNNNYFVSDTYYGWTVNDDAIGDRTDIGNWWEWFRGPSSGVFMQALFTESGQHSPRSFQRMTTDPGGENEIIMFKSCFPNSHLLGSPDDPATTGDNPMRGVDQASAPEAYTVANAKGIYNDLLPYFAAHPEKLFVLVTSPPLWEGETNTTEAANARALTDWLVNDWLEENNYTGTNVAVFNFYNVLTSNGGSVESNDVDSASGNHHRWRNGAIEYVQTVDRNVSAYANDGDSHPTTAGSQKATAEFVPLLNVFYNRWKNTAPVPDDTPTPTQTTTTNPLPEDLVQPGDLRYLGAFRLPDDGERPRTFEYGGGAMTFRPDGDTDGPDDGFPGSLFITGHERMPYDELPDGDQVAEVSIPVPVRSGSAASLNTATFLQPFTDVAAGSFTAYGEIPRVGMQYLNHAATGPLIHLAWGQHFQEEATDPTHAWFHPDLAHPALQGFWYIGNQSLYSVNDYMMEIPAAWADRSAQSRYLGTGRFRDGGWSGMGPSLFAYVPWVDASGTPAGSGTHLAETPLLLYENSRNTEDIERTLANYQHADSWDGGAWLTTSSGKTAVVFVGNKATGAKYWYGYINPQGADYPCVDEAFVGDFPVCRMADGPICPEEDLVECAGHESERGWWSTRFEAQMIFYDPATLAQVADGTVETWEPQPYATLSFDEHLLLNPDGVEELMIGSGVQRRYKIGDMTYDRTNGLIYVLELFADGAKPVVHVWQVS